ncbi:9338_t:CDS:1 [Gigaspora margarita]|uniref:9338_t:CDS:1 n=1 Tax=Gigaspora margarita TaxID=4874 RepID=A0ABM8VVV3_GIGMA|nr:9338_t:CDS:1 [Gigaspora margarita]
MELVEDERTEVEQNIKTQNKRKRNREEIVEERIAINGVMYIREKEVQEDIIMKEEVSNSISRENIENPSAEISKIMEQIVSGMSLLRVNKTTEDPTKEVYKRPQLRQKLAASTEEIKETKRSKTEEIREVQAENQLRFTIWDVPLEYDARHIRRCLSIYSKPNIITWINQGDYKLVYLGIVPKMINEE